MAKQTYEYSFIKEGVKTEKEAIAHITDKLGGFSKLKYEHMKAFIVEFKPEDKEDFKKNAVKEKDGVTKYSHGKAKSWFFEKYGLKTKKSGKAGIEDDFDKW